MHSQVEEEEDDEDEEGEEADDEEVVGDGAANGEALTSGASPQLPVPRKVRHVS